MIGARRKRPAHGMEAGLPVSTVARMVLALLLALLLVPATGLGSAHAGETAKSGDNPLKGLAFDPSEVTVEMMSECPYCKEAHSESVSVHLNLQADNPDIPVGNLSGSANVSIADESIAKLRFDGADGTNLEKYTVEGVAVGSTQLKASATTTAAAGGTAQTFEASATVNVIEAAPPALRAESAEAEVPYRSFAPTFVQLVPFSAGQGGGGSYGPLFRYDETDHVAFSSREINSPDSSVVVPGHHYSDFIGSVTFSDPSVATWEEGSLSIEVLSAGTTEVTLTDLWGSAATCTLVVTAEQIASTPDGSASVAAEDSAADDAIKAKERELGTSLGLAVEPQTTLAGELQAAVSTVVTESRLAAGVFDIHFEDQTGAEVAWGPDEAKGMLRVRIAINEGMARFDPASLKVHYLDPATGAATEMASWVEDGFLVFLTPHFSNYLVTGELPEGEVSALTPLPGDDAASKDAATLAATGDGSVSPVLLLTAACAFLIVALLALRTASRRHS